MRTPSFVAAASLLAIPSYALRFTNVFPSTLYTDEPFTITWELASGDDSRVSSGVCSVTGCITIFENNTDRKFEWTPKADSEAFCRGQTCYVYIKQFGTAAWAGSSSRFTIARRNSSDSSSAATSSSATATSARSTSSSRSSTSTSTAAATAGANSSSSTTTTVRKSGLSTGAKAGIAIGAVIGGLIIIGLVALFCCRGTGMTRARTRRRRTAWLDATPVSKQGKKGAVGGSVRDVDGARDVEGKDDVIVAASAQPASTRAGVARDGDAGVLAPSAPAVAAADDVRGDRARR